MERCSETGCNRRPEPGWAMCDSHVRLWLQAFGPKVEAPLRVRRIAAELGMTGRR